MGKGLGRHFSKEDIQMANKCMKRCVISHHSSELKSTVTYHLICGRMVGNKKNLTADDEDMEIGPLIQSMGMLNVQLLCKIVWKFFKILIVELPYNPAVPLLCVYPKKKHSSQ